MTDIDTNIDNYYIELPDMYSEPYQIDPIPIGNKEYYAYYKWNTRAKLCFFSLYKIDNETKTYLINPTALQSGIVLSKNITDTDWSGSLSFMPIDNTLETYNEQNFNTDFYLLYVPEVS